jgi:hypothetical protein
MGAQDDACGVLHQRLTQCFSRICEERVKRLLDLCPDLSDLSGANLVTQSQSPVSREGSLTTPSSNNDNLLFIIIVVVLASVILLLLMVLIILCVYLRRNAPKKRRKKRNTGEDPLVENDYLQSENK